MKKINLLLFSMLLFVSVAQAQDVKKYIYVQLLGHTRFLSSKVNVNIDYGQYKGFWANQTIVDSETGRPIRFNSMVDAMNYMGNEGWEFVQAYVVTVGNQNVYHWLLKRSLTDEEAAVFIPQTYTEKRKEMREEKRIERKETEGERKQERQEKKDKIKKRFEKLIQDNSDQSTIEEKE